MDRAERNHIKPIEQSALFVSSLCIHIGIIFLLLYKKEAVLNFLKKEPVIDEVPHNQNNNYSQSLPPALTARGGAFGAPVTWHTNQQQQATAQSDQNTQSPAHTEFQQSNNNTQLDAKESAAAEPIEKSASESTNNEKKEGFKNSNHEEKKDVQITPIAQKVENEASEISFLMKEQKKDEHAAQQTEQHVVQPTEQHAVSTTPQTAHELMTTDAPASEHMPKKRRHKKKSPSVTQQGYRSLTLADLAQGFIDSLEQHGTDWVTRAGDKNKRPDAEELKKLNYIYNLLWYMNNEWRIKSDKILPHITAPVATEIKVVIKKDGTLHDVIILQSSTNAAYDAFIVKGVRRASPYPPIPNQMALDIFDVVLVIACAGLPHYSPQLQRSSLLKHFNNQP